MTFGCRPQMARHYRTGGTWPIRIRPAELSGEIVSWADGRIVARAIFLVCRFEISEFTALQSRGRTVWQISNSLHICLSRNFQQFVRDILRCTARRNGKFSGKRVGRRSYAAMRHFILSGSVDEPQISVQLLLVCRHLSLFTGLTGIFGAVWVAGLMVLWQCSRPNRRFEGKYPKRIKPSS